MTETARGAPLPLLPVEGVRERLVLAAPHLQLLLHRVQVLLQVVQHLGCGEKGGGIEGLVLVYNLEKWIKLAMFVSLSNPIDLPNGLTDRVSPWIDPTSFVTSFWMASRSFLRAPSLPLLFSWGRRREDR